MTNVFLLGAKYSQEGAEIDKSTLKEMWDIRSKDFARCGVSDNNFVYKICCDAYKASQQGRALVNDEASHHALRSMADIGLFLNRQKYKREKISFNNPAQLLEITEASRTLKGVHPDLFERYGFRENLQAIVKLQPENALSDRIQSVMDEIFEERSSKKRETVKDDKIKERE